MRINEQQLLQDLYPKILAEAKRMGSSPQSVNEWVSILTKDIKDEIAAVSAGKESNISTGYGINITDQQLNTIYNLDTAKPEADISLAKQALIKSGNTNPSYQDAVNYINATGTNFKTEANKAINQQNTVQGATVKKTVTIGEVRDYMSKNGVDYSTAYNALTGTNDSPPIDGAPKFDRNNPGIFKTEQDTAGGYTLRAYNNETGQWGYVRPGEYVKGVSLTPNESGRQGAYGASGEGTVDANGKVINPNTGLPETPTIDLNSIYSIADEAVKNGIISQTDADLYKQVTKQYAGANVNYDDIIKTFNEISKTSIDPEFAQRARAFTTDLLQNKDYLEKTRALELEQEGITANNNIENAKQGLEREGLIFSSRAVKALGAKSAYDQDGNPIEGGIPNQIPEGGTFAEGTVNTSNRLMSTSSLARNQKALQDLGRQAEDYLGTTEANKLGISYKSAGIDMGTLEKEKEQAKTSTLQNLYSNYQKEQERKTTQLT